MIVDCHCHAGKGDGLTGPWDTDAPLGDYLRRAAAAGIGRTIVFPAFHSNYARANAELARIVAAHPRRLWGFAMVHPASDRGHVTEMIATAVERYGFRGIKVHRHDAPITREVCEAARTWRIPILYDITGDVAAIELLAKEYPEVNFIIPHLGSFADDWRAQLGVTDHLVRHPNVYADTSGVRRFDMLLQAVRRAGARKILFGSDGPWLHPAVEMAKVHALRLPAHEERLILGGNVLRLIGTPHRREPTNGRERRAAAAAYAA
ncbi:amidohydrolase family protein [Microvirga aerilata]|uniref:Amidohydrolase family protein n=1 Tax=Microvirga aerilata TaxID=670292 RepID=A0A937D045_9HYPH|nr:amidohydrolase family protein [Microvirga aerilata]MBL0407384.1 amidohydrolase family protein [Microvirga aerilata]